MADPSLTEVVTDDYGETIGYACRKLVEDNQVYQIDHTFYVDLRYSDTSATAGEAVEFLRSNLVRSVADGYGITNGVRCANPPIDGSSWLVQVKSESRQFSQVPENIWDSCRKLVPVEGERCVVYQGVVTLSVLGSEVAPDADNFIQAVVEESEIFRNAPFDIAYVGRPQIDPTGQSESGRNALKPPVVATGKPQNYSKETRKSVTIVGGLLVSAFFLAFLGILFVLYRRRRAYLREREAHASLIKSGRNLHNTGTDSQSQDGGNPKDLPEPTSSDDFVHPRGRLHDELDPEDFPNNVMFDLGNTFKDQLMGVHARSVVVAPKAPAAQLGGSGSMPDNTSDSDADSWAQTDGTIGSLELQLEPITAEV